MLERIFTGAEAGAERGALVGTCLLPFAYGGWLPRNREVEDGQIGDDFVNLHEVPVGESLSPAEKNILDSDATVFVLHADEAKSSSRIAKLVAFANTASKPTLFLTLAQGNNRGSEITNIVQFVGENDVRVLNITGSRESESPGIQDSTEKVVWLMLKIMGVAGVLPFCSLLRRLKDQTHGNWPDGFLLLPTHLHMRRRAWSMQKRPRRNIHVREERRRRSAPLQT